MNSYWLIDKQTSGNVLFDNLYKEDITLHEKLKFFEFEVKAIGMYFGK